MLIVGAWQLLVAMAGKQRVRSGHDSLLLLLLLLPDSLLFVAGDF
jgi:hypothetical protein